jgi:hypothetical protein
LSRSLPEWHISAVQIAGGAVALTLTIGKTAAKPEVAAAGGALKPP